MALKLYSKPRKRRIGPEARLQMAVVQYLKLAGVPGLLYFSVPNEQKCSVQRGAMLKKMGRISGVSDLVVIIPDKEVLFLELKAKGESPTTSQCEFGELATFAGHQWCWADCIDEAISILKDYGAIKNVACRRASPFSKEAA